MTEVLGNQPFLSYLSDGPLFVCEEIKYLGHAISDDWMEKTSIVSAVKFMLKLTRW